MTEKTESNVFVRAVGDAVDWAEETAGSLWRKAEQDPTKAVEVAAAGLALVGFGAGAIGLRMAGYGVRPMLTRELLREAAAAERANAGVTGEAADLIGGLGFAPGRALTTSARDDITGFTRLGPLQINALGRLPLGAEIDRTVLLSDMRARANVPLATMRGWVEKNAVNGQIESTDASTSVARLKQGSGVVLRSDLDMSIISNMRGELQIADHASGEATLLDRSFGGTKTVVFPGGRTRITSLDYDEWARMNRLYYEQSAGRQGNLSVLNSIVPKGKA